MTLDPSIILRGRGVELNDPLETAQRAAQLGETLTKSNQAKQQMALSTLKGELMKKHTVVDPSGEVTLNKKAYLADLAGKNPSLAFEEQENLMKRDNDQMGMNLEKLKKQVDIAQNLTWGITDQASWTRAKQEGQRLGLPGADKIPDQYDPSMLETMKYRTLSAKEQIEQKLADQKANLEQQKFGLDKEKFASDKKFKERELQNSEKQKSTEVGKLAAELRKERSSLPVTKATQEISAAYNKIQSAAKSPSAAGDLSLIFGYMKMLDPGSTVREGEFANAQNAAGIPDRVKNMYNKAISGERLGDAQRGDFVNQAKGIYSSQMDLQNQVDSQYREMAKQAGADEKNVILNFQANQSSSSFGPDVLAYAQKYNISPDQANAIKQQRTGQTGSK